MNVIGKRAAVAVMLLIAALPFSNELYAALPSYTYLEGSFSIVEDDMLEGQLTSIYGSYAVNEHFHLSLSYDDLDASEDKTLNATKYDLLGVGLGFGFHAIVADNTTLNIDFSHVITDTDILGDYNSSIRDDSYLGLISLGLRHQVTDDLEVNGGVKTRLVEWKSGSDNRLVHAYIGSAYKLSPQLSITGTVTVGEDSYTGYNVGFRVLL